MENYKKFINIWELIKTLNDQKIFDYGTATYNTKSGDIVIEFENEKQKEKYKSIFE